MFNRVKRIKIGIAILTSVTLVGVISGGGVWAKPSFEEKSFGRDLGKSGYVSDEIIVKFKGDEKPFRVIKVSQDKVKEKVNEYREKREVEYAEPNYIAHASMVPNDPYYSYQWHMQNSGYGGIKMEAAWDTSTGSGVTVAVIDTGVAYENYGEYKKAPDLAGTLFTAGHDFVNDDTHPNDDNGHGTHVTGTVAQTTNNSLGVTGVAFNSTIMPVKVLDRNGSGTYANVAAGIYYAADNGAKVINLSLGGSADSQTLKDAVAYAYGKGVTVVAAAGNENSSTISYPAAYDDYVIAVGATRYDETRAYYSNYGSRLDLVAPGGDLTVDQNNDGYGDGVLQQTFGRRVGQFGYYFYQGTSMASPHVAGVAALVIANGVIGPGNVRAALQTTAEDLGDPNWDATYGWGLVDAFAALNWTPVPPVPNNPPVANNQSVITNEDTPLAITLTATDPDGDPLTYSIVTNPANGVLSGTAPTVTYTPNLNFYGSDSFTFKANDGKVDSNSATVSITVNPVNDPPVANAGPDQSAYVAETVYFDGSASYDPDGTIVSYEWKEGATVLGTTAIITYDFAVGTHTITLTVTDNGGLTGSDTAVVTISEAPVGPTMHVGDITFTSSTRTKNGTPYCKVTATVPILDALNVAVSGATVDGNWSGDYTASVSGTTNGEGTVNFRTPWVKDCGTFTFTVDNVVKTGWTYNSTADVETSDSITLPY